MSLTDCCIYIVLHQKRMSGFGQSDKRLAVTSGVTVWWDCCWLAATKACAAGIN